MNMPEKMQGPVHTVLDTVCEIYDRGFAHAKRVATMHWYLLAPAERLRVQIESTRMAPDDLDQSERCATDMLLLDLANDHPELLDTLSNAA